MRSSRSEADSNSARDSCCKLRMAVHFQRIEFFVAQAFGVDLLAAENPPLGFGIEAAQLIAHALDGGFHLAQGHPRIVDLLLDPATEDRGFAGQIDQLVEQFGRDLDHVRAGIGGRRRASGLVAGAGAGGASDTAPGD